MYLWIHIKHMFEIMHGFLCGKTFQCVCQYLHILFDSTAFWNVLFLSSVLAVKWYFFILIISCPLKWNYTLQSIFCYTWSFAGCAINHSPRGGGISFFCSCVYSTCFPYLWLFHYWYFPSFDLFVAGL